ncbi:unnamed protein product [Didymodactylos carnosus]|uniref:Tyrosine-protein phosphatase domain-containing protein n=1 Tax=Didymodactylos carnosus TaxID=1234261 RepID=A0A813PT99_9BILA|nr:unnamed protein product [Didymodactylos carnosus]CAF1115124.1 unnamed protein product [Didymodactylos carnosus]CAF3539227.1 unnamed protein product [Didymodactylos carnosus]CAF3885117.1 unnamed protein product [Didymodactylos carnosus]
MTGMGNFNRMSLLMSISEITPQIYISGQMAATPDQISRLSITYIINVAVESSSIIYPKHVKLEKYDILDYPTAPISNYFNVLTDKIHQHLSSNKQNKVLIHCMAGISRIVQTSFGHIPDVTLNEIKELKGQQSVTTTPFFPLQPNVNANVDIPFTQTLPRASGREMTLSTGTLRSRSLAGNRQMLPAPSTVSSLVNSRANDNAYPVFATKPSAFLTPTATRYGVGTRSNPPPSLPASSSQSTLPLQYYVTNRPFATSSNMKTIGTNRQLNNNFSLSTATNPDAKPHYETTYRASFIKPLNP